MSTSHATTAGRPSRTGARLSRLAGALATAATLVLAVALLAAAAPIATGLRPEIERSDSMQPVLGVGDLIYARPIAAGQARVHDVVTFADPERPGKTLTHRIRRIRRLPDGRVAIITRGDANTGTEQWTISPSGRISKMSFAVPAVGGWLAWIQPRFPAVAVVVVGLLCAGGALRRIWRGQRSAKSDAGVPAFFPLPSSAGVDSERSAA